MDATHQPVQIGVCHHCHLPLYEHAPVSPVPLSHVACAVHAARA